MNKAENARSICIGYALAFWASIDHLWAGLLFGALAIVLMYLDESEAFWQRKLDAARQQSREGTE